MYPTNDIIRIVGNQHCWHVNNNNRPPMLISNFPVKLFADKQHVLHSILPPRKNSNHNLTVVFHPFVLAYLGRTVTTLYLGCTLKAYIKTVVLQSAMPATILTVVGYHQSLHFQYIVCLYI